MPGWGPQQLHISLMGKLRLLFRLFHAPSSQAFHPQLLTAGVPSLAGSLLGGVLARGLMSTDLPRETHTSSATLMLQGAAPDCPLSRPHPANSFSCSNGPSAKVDVHPPLLLARLSPLASTDRKNPRRRGKSQHTHRPSPSQ